MLMRRLVHPNIVTLIGVASNEEPVMIVMEFAPGGSVLDAVQAKPGPSVFTRIKYCHGAALGLQYLAREGVIHRDVAVRNCLIGKHGVAKISDFGLSIVGTLKKEKTLKKVFHDGKEPYGEMNAKEVRKYVLSGHTLGNESDHYPMYMWTITLSCFERDPAQRPSFHTIAGNIWACVEDFKEHSKMKSFSKFCHLQK